MEVGAGILGGGIGQAVDNNATNIGLVVPRAPTHGCAATSNAPECQKFNVVPKSQQLRWYEMR